MSAIDKVLKVDWSQAEYIGDGVYAMRVDGDIALRADRGEENHVIVFESPMLEELNNFADRTRGQQGQQRPKSHFVVVESFQLFDQKPQRQEPQRQESQGQESDEPTNSTGEVRINTSAGLIPAGAKLEHHTHWLEMVGTDQINGRPTHPLTISLPRESMDELNALGHTGLWILRRVETRPDHCDRA